MLYEGEKEHEQKVFKMFTKEFSYVEIFEMVKLCSLENKVGDIVSPT